MSMVMMDVLNKDRERSREIADRLGEVKIGELFDFIGDNLMKSNALEYREYAVSASTLVMMAFIARLRPRDRQRALDDIMGSLLASMNASIVGQAEADSIGSGRA